jgi:hypothetical protein
MIWHMAIVIRNQGRKWEKTERVIFADGAQLQKLLYTVARAYSNKDGGSSSQTSPEKLGYPAAGLRTWLVWMHKETFSLWKRSLCETAKFAEK